MLAALLGEDLSIFRDHNALTRGDVAHQAKAQALQGHRLRGEDVILARALITLTQDQRTNAVGVTKADDAKARDHRHAGISPLGPALQNAHRCEDRIWVEREATDGLLQLMGKNIEQHLRIGLGVDVTPITAVHVVLEFTRVGEVAVVTEHDAKGRIHIEGLGLLSTHGTAGRGITNMADAHVAVEVAHVTGAKDIAHQARAPRQMNAFALGRGDARRILSTMLHEKQRIVERLIHRMGCNNSNDTTHG